MPADPESALALRSGAVRETVGGRFELTIGDDTRVLQIEDVGDYHNPKPSHVGTVQLDEPGEYEVSMKPIDDGNWNGFSFQGMVLKKK